MATSVPIQRAAPRYETLPKPALVLAGLATTSGVIHVVATLQHLDVNWMFPVFFALVGAGQLLAGWWVYHKPDDLRMLRCIAVASVVVALVWVFDRTTGLPFGPDGGKVSSVGVADTIATFQEFAFAAIVVALVRRPQRLSWMATATGIRLTSAMLTVALLVAAMGGHEH